MNNKTERIEKLGNLLLNLKSENIKILKGYDNDDKFRCFYVVIGNEICAEVFNSNDEYRVWSFDLSKEERENSILCETKAPGSKYGHSLKENKWVFVEPYSNNGFKYVKNFVDLEQMMNTLKELIEKHVNGCSRKIYLHTYTSTEKGNYREI